VGGDGEHGQHRDDGASMGDAIELAGDCRKAAGVEILLFGPDRHDGAGVLAQPPRLAVVGRLSQGETDLQRSRAPRPATIALPRRTPRLAV
jgi:hypothetical protein